MSNRKKMLPATGRMLIGGQLVESSGGNWIECINPANEECIGKVPRGTAADVEQAVAAAENAQVAWVELSVARRQAGVNSNRLTDDLRLDPLSGTAVLNGVPVTVAPLPNGGGR